MWLKPGRHPALVGGASKTELGNSLTGDGNSRELLGVFCPWETPMSAGG